MNIAFRVDASDSIGVGHFMRCLTLANELKKDGAHIRFIVRDLPGYLLDILRAYSIECIDLEQKANNQTRHTSSVSVNQERDAKSTIESLSDVNWHLLVVDHYALDAYWEGLMGSVCLKLMVIDDLANRRHECDFLLDQNLGRTKADYISLIPNDCVVLIGPQYALLRPEFAEFRPYSLSRRTVSKINKILITMGGMDKNNATAKILEALMDCSLSKDCEIIVTMGPNSSWLDYVNQLTKKMPWMTTVKVNPQNMAELMANSDLAIGGAGITAWERCCLGLPSLVVILANNQLKVADALKENGCAKVLGGPDEISKNLQSFIQGFLTDEELLKMSHSSRLITDGTGVTRVKKIILDEYEW